MLIKNVIKKGPQRGTPILYTAEEAAPFAVERAVKATNTKEKIFWVLKKSIKVGSFSSHQGTPDSYEAWITGTANVGYTDVATDKFHVAKNHSFKVHYKSSKDEHGAPDIAIVDCEIQPISGNPQTHAPKVEAAPVAVAVEEKLPAGVKKRKMVDKASG
jgi:hypothetical protein